MALWSLELEKIVAVAPSVWRPSFCPSLALRAVVCLAATSLTGCGERRAEAAVSALLPDASSARFQSVERRGVAVCGQVNTADNGSAKGYRRFIYRERVAVIEPAQAYPEEEIAAFERTCRIAQQGGSGMDMAACGLAGDTRRVAGERQRFESDWARICG